MKGVQYLRNKLNIKRIRVLERYKYYEMKNGMHYMSTVIPERFGWMTSSPGWCANAVDSLADRLQFRAFQDDNFDMQGIFDMNNPDVLFDSAILGALISSCDFIYISQGENGIPRLQVIDGGNATGIIDPITGLLTEGYAVLERDDANSPFSEPVLEAYFTPDNTHFLRKGDRQWKVVANPAPYPLLVPIIHRPDAMRPFGHSVISRAAISYTQAALRTIFRSEVSAEFYAFPQKYVTGLEPDAEGFENWRATISSFLRFDKDEDGDHPVLGQFQQQNMQPFTDQLRQFASLFAGETGLTLDDMGFLQDNPSSAEAIKAAHEKLRLKARKAQRDFGSGFINAGYLAACVRDEFPYERRQVYLTKAKWRPIFEPDAAQLGGIGDAALKIQQAFPEYFTEEKLLDLTGI